MTTDESSDASETEGLSWLAGLTGKPCRSDPWDRWPAGQEPKREVNLLWTDEETAVPMIPSATLHVEGGILPLPRYDQATEDFSNLRMFGRWNAIWKGSILSHLSLDCFSTELPEVVSIEFDPADPDHLLAAYVGSFPGMWGIHLVADDFTAKWPRGSHAAHEVTARDPRLASQIATRYPGICPHSFFFEYEMAFPSTGDGEDFLDAVNWLDGFLGVGEGEPMPGFAELQNSRDSMSGILAIVHGEADTPDFPMFEPTCATFDTYQAIAIAGLSGFEDVTMISAQSEITDDLAANVAFPDAIDAIRSFDSDRLPLWLDFSDESGDSAWQTHAAGIDQPLYGVAIIERDDEPGEGPFRAAIPVGRRVGGYEEAVPLCGLAIGPDDSWRFPVPEGKIGALTAHSGGVTVREIPYPEFLTPAPEIDREMIRREIAGHMAHCTEWILARVGAILNALEAGHLVLEKKKTGKRSYDLARNQYRKQPPAEPLRGDGERLVDLLREHGSIVRVSQVLNASAIDVRQSLESDGVNPDRVLDDEIMVRYRRFGTVDAVVRGLRLHRGRVEACLRERGIAVEATPVPHDVTDPILLEAISAYDLEGTLADAGARLGVSAETVRRRMLAAGVRPDPFRTGSVRKVDGQAKETWQSEGRSIPSAAKKIGVDPRTLKRRLIRAGVSDREIMLGSDSSSQTKELLDQLGSIRAVAAITGLSQATVRRHISNANRELSPGRPQLTNKLLDQSVVAYEEHGSIRAAATALGVSPSGFAHRLRTAHARSS